MPERPTSWQTFLRAHWGAIAAADFFTTEVWTWRSLVTHYTVFVMDLASRRVQIVGSTPIPTTCSCAKWSARSPLRTRVFSLAHRVLICDRDAGELPPGTQLTLRLLAKIRRRVLLSSYVRSYERHTAERVDEARVRRWEIVNLAARALYEVPGEGPRPLQRLQKEFARGEVS